MLLHTSPIKASQETLQAILNALPNPVFLVDRMHRLVMVNDALCDMLGRPREELVNRIDYNLPEEQKEVFWQKDNEVFATGEPNDNEEVLTDGTGTLRVILTRKRLIRLPTNEGEQSFILATITDVTRFREAESRAQYLAEHDTLTGLANRTRLNNRLELAIQSAAKDDKQVALILIDLDGFKAINDSHGHPVGDEVLRIVAKRMAGLVRSIDTVARFGGDEFCIVQSAGQQPEGAFRLADRIMSSLTQPMIIDALRLSVSASIGISLFPDDGTDPEMLLQRADTALYSVKRSGRGDYMRFDEHPSLLPSSAWDIETDLRTALAADQLSLAFQPFASAADGKVRGFEALARWQHPTRGQIPPETFIPAAESSGLVQRLGFWVLHKACAAAAGWEWPLQVSVNISPAQFDNENLPSVVEQALAASGLPPERLELEIAETALLGNSVRVSETLDKLKKLRVHLALDDFGSGWSTLATLQNFKFDRIKIDRSFIGNIESDARSVAVVRAVLSLAQSLQVPVTAEGIEAAAQIRALRQLGCDELQGYFIGRPSDEAAMPDILDWKEFLGS